MSVLEYPDAINAPELQVWNNAAFDDNEGSGFSAVKPSWSFESDCSKENLSPVPKTPTFAASNSVPFKPLNGASRRLSVAPRKMGFEVEDLGKIDSEIEEIEKEISRLNSKLELLKLEKAQKAAERRGRVVAAKFMEPPAAKQSVKNSDGLRKIEESLNLSARPKVNRRGMSLGPSEIIAGAAFRRPGKLEITPGQKIQDRRKSCFWKLQDIDELRVTKERGKSSSLSPKSRKTASKTGVSKQAATTIGGSKRPVKMVDKVLASIEPKKLFKEGEKSVPNKKSVKAGRVVASRYNQIGSSSVAAADGRKRSLPDDDKEDGNRCEKKRVSLVGKPRGIGREGSRSVGAESRMKKRWEIPSEVVVFQGVEEDGVAAIDVLPKIRTVRCVNDTPRGSGPAKRAAELVGMKKYFSNSDEFCQELSFAEEEDGEEE
ncbi:PREDICTED: uncharacterized protein LOC101297573 [Fragaria vesca subsp. vesca]|uniref:uncharacterized protein LOC101297573 n=1 Tax=Fragaria vesca subsp. vesca TaxID=101020 RepID=UPI0002C2F074|nr:PREDICTED: uncharacterized protein LOC101297573 [Fragaria vesca subsp. vesca]